jgi:hypothetical protein
MTIFKILSIGLIASAMFTTAASAYENSFHGRYAMERAHRASIFPAQGAAGGFGMLSRSAGASTEPLEQPGGTCDHGDNPQIC